MTTEDIDQEKALDLSVIQAMCKTSPALQRFLGHSLRHLIQQVMFNAHMMREAETVVASDMYKCRIEQNCLDMVEFLERCGINTNKEANSNEHI